MRRRDREKRKNEGGNAPVHAIGADDRRLFPLRLIRSRNVVVKVSVEVEGVSVASLKTASQNPSEEEETRGHSPLSLEVLMQLINQDTNPIKPQPFALFVEIKVGVVHSRVREGVQGALVRFLDGLFVPGRVDEVDEELVPVERDLLLEMPAEGIGLPCRVCSLSSVWELEANGSGERAHSRGEVEHLEIGLVSQVVDLCPINRHRSPRLHKRKPRLATSRPTGVGLRSEDDNLFRLVEVGHVARLVDPARKVPRPGAVPVSSRDEAELEIAAVDTRVAELDDCTRARGGAASTGDELSQRPTFEE